MEICCRICWDSTACNMISPCKCGGTMKFVHADCLAKWIEQKSLSYCEVCNSHYDRQIVKNLPVPSKPFFSAEAMNTLTYVYYALVFIVAVLKAFSLVITFTEKYNNYMICQPDIDICAQHSHGRLFQECSTVYLEYHGGRLKFIHYNDNGQRCKEFYQHWIPSTSQYATSEITFGYFYLNYTQDHFNCSENILAFLHNNTNSQYIFSQSSCTN